jgi:hypothetical protein
MDAIQGCCRESGVGGRCERDFSTSPEHPNLFTPIISRYQHASASWQGSSISRTHSTSCGIISALRNQRCWSSERRLRNTCSPVIWIIFRTRSRTRREPSLVSAKSMLIWRSPKVDAGKFQQWRDEYQDLLLLTLGNRILGLTGPAKIRLL